MRISRFAPVALSGVCLPGRRKPPRPRHAFNLNFEFSNGTPPAGATPWVTITIDDAADAIGANGVASSPTWAWSAPVGRRLAEPRPAARSHQITETAVNTSAVGASPSASALTPSRPTATASSTSWSSCRLRPGSFAAQPAADHLVDLDLEQPSRRATSTSRARRAAAGFFNAAATCRGSARTARTAAGSGGRTGDELAARARSRGARRPPGGSRA